MFTKREIEEQIKNIEQEISDLQIQIMALEEKIGRANKRLKEFKDILREKRYKE